MQFRTLGKTNMNISVIGVGTWQFGGEWGKEYSQAEADAIMHKAQDLGVNLVDTAECYGDHTSERLVGGALKDRRDQWIVATKFGHKFHKHLQRTWHWKPEEVRRQLEDSLAALQTDHIDLYQFHSGSDEHFDTDGLWEMLARQKEAGKILHVGVSIGSNLSIRQAQDASRVGAEALQLVYNRIDNNAELELLPIAKSQNLGILARVPLASGYLSGKYTLDSTFGENDVRASHSDEKRLSKIKEAQRIAREEVPEGISLAQWALAWCLKNPVVSCVIPGCKDVRQVVENAAAADLQI
ncbi:MAG: aldo/keto reductase [Chitinivibrionales bacterium]|nr:aldo/keto reductase [Chitinivibrionales bacterium]